MSDTETKEVVPEVTTDEGVEISYPTICKMDQVLYNNLMRKLQVEQMKLNKIGTEHSLWLIEVGEESGYDGEIPYLINADGMLISAKAQEKLNKGEELTEDEMGIPVEDEIKAKERKFQMSVIKQTNIINLADIAVGEMKEKLAVKWKYSGAVPYDINKEGKFEARETRPTR